MKRWNNVAEFQPGSVNVKPQARKWKTQAICLSWLGHSNIEKDGELINSISKMHPLDGIISIVIVRFCKLNPSTLSSIKHFLSKNIMIEEVWIESTQGFPNEFIDDMQQKNPMVRFKVNGNVIGRAYFLSRKQFLWSLRMARKPMTFPLRSSEIGSFMVACIGWNENMSHAEVENMVSIMYCINSFSEFSFPPAPLSLDTGF